MRSDERHKLEVEQGYHQQCIPLLYCVQVWALLVFLSLSSSAAWATLPHHPQWPDSQVCGDTARWVTHSCTATHKRRDMEWYPANIDILRVSLHSQSWKRESSILMCATHISMQYAHKPQKFLGQAFFNLLQNIILMKFESIWQMCLALYLSHVSSLHYSSYTLLSCPPFPFSLLLLPLLHPSFLPPPPTSSLLPLPSPSSLSLSLPAHPGHPSPEALDLLRQTLCQLPNTNYTLLKYLMHHLARVVEHSSESVYAHSMHHLVSLVFAGRGLGTRLPLGLGGRSEFMSASGLLK